MNTRIYEEATNWLVKHREADLDSKERGVFDNWLRESPQHVRAYLEMSGLWEDVYALDANWNPTPEQLITRARREGNVYSLADTVRATVRECYPQPVPPHPEGSVPSERSGPRGEISRGGRMRSLAIAATILIAVVAMTTLYWFNRNTYATNIGEQRSIVLADGSTVELNSRSRVRIRYSDSRRDVDLLDGQALFRVARNTARPFVVHSGTTDVRAVGTQFDVYKKRAGTVVTVVEGKVAILSSTLSTPQKSPVPDEKTGTGAETPANFLAYETSSGTAVSDLPSPPWTVSTPRGPSKSEQPSGSRKDEVGAGAVVLAAGEQITVPAVKPSRAGNLSTADSPQPANIAAATAWTYRTLMFDSSPLTEVAEEFNRYNTRQLVITDPALANIHISGMFSSVDPALLLKFLRTQPELNVEETDTQIRISKRRA